MTASDFSNDAKRFAKSTSRMELINSEKLQKHLNENFGPKWPLKIDSITMGKNY